MVWFLIAKHAYNNVFRPCAKCSWLICNCKNNSIAPDVIMTRAWQPNKNEHYANIGQVESVWYIICRMFNLMHVHEIVWYKINKH